MSGDPYIIYVVLLIFCALVLLLISMIAIYLRLVKKLAKIKEAENVYQKVEDAQLQAEKIIEDANKAAGQIITNVEVFSEQEKKKFEESIGSSMQMYANQYNQILKESQDELTRLLSGIPNEMRVNLGNQVSDFSRLLQTEVENTRVRLQSGVEQIYASTQNQMEQYRIYKINKLNGSIVEIIEEVSKRVLGKQITLNEQEKLVMKALEEAKMRLGFSDVGQKKDEENG